MIGRDKLSDHKGLRCSNGESNVQLQISLQLKKVEKKIIEALAKRRFSATSTRRPAVSKAVVYLLRVAFRCISEHGRCDDPEEITESRALSEGLRIGRWRKKKREGQN